MPPCRSPSRRFCCAGATCSARMPRSLVNLRRPAAVRGDVVAMAAIAAIVTISVAYRASHHDQPPALLLLALAIPPLFLRDRRPLAALIMALAARMVIPDNDALLLPVLAVLYTIAARQTRTTAVAAGTAVVIATVAAEAAWGKKLEHG